jgi:hypothetical protein
MWALFFANIVNGQIMEQQNNIIVQPKLALKGAVAHSEGNKQFHKIILTVTNKDKFPSKMFELTESEKLPPNPCSEKLQVRNVLAVYTEEGKLIAGCMPLNSIHALDAQSFLIEKGTSIPAYVYVVITDLKTGANYKSNLISPFTGDTKDEAKQTMSRTGAGTGTVKGVIEIRNITGNTLGNFACKNLKISVHLMHSEAGELKWVRTSTASGIFSNRQCSFTIPNVPAGSAFVVSVTPEFPRGCGQSTFKATSSFPMEVKAQQELIYNVFVQEIGCIMIK